MAFLKGKPHDPTLVTRKDCDRFWSKVYDADGDANQCWIMNGSTGNHGYPNFYYSIDADSAPGVPYRQRIRYITAHRFSALIDSRMGAKINDLCVLHHCDNKRCVNPNHLFLGTQQMNVWDMDSKGRRVTNPVKGTFQPNSVFTESAVRTIRKHKQAHPAITYAELSRIYHYHPSSIRNLFVGSWQWLK